MRSFLGALAITLGMLIGGSINLHAAVDCQKVEPDYKPDDLRAPIRFYYRDHPCTGNAVSWPFLAVGVITETTPMVFAEFAKNNHPDTPIEFIVARRQPARALKLGEMIRKAGYDTSLGEFCASACAYAIMGGVKRYVDQQKEFDQNSDYDNRFAGASGTKLGIHQFYRSEALSKPQKKAFSAIDKSADQMLMGILLEYTLRMGVDTHLVSVASSIPPWEDIRWLTRDEIINWNVDNTHRRYTDLVFRAFGRAGSYVEMSNVRGPDVSYLRLFCKNAIKEPLLAFITDHPFQKTASAISPENEIKAATERVRGLLTRMNLNFELGSDKRLSVPAQIQDVEGIRQGKDVARVFAVIRGTGLGREDAERFTRVALGHNGNVN